MFNSLSVLTRYVTDAVTDEYQVFKPGSLILQLHSISGW